MSESPGVTPDEWVRMTPQQQAAHAYQYGPPPPGYLVAPTPRAGTAQKTIAVFAIGFMVLCALIVAAQYLR